MQRRRSDNKKMFEDFAKMAEVIIHYKDGSSDSWCDDLPEWASSSLLQCIKNQSNEKFFVLGKKLIAIDEIRMFYVVYPKNGEVIHNKQ